MSRHQKKRNQFRAGQWKQLYPPEDHGNNHFSASHRRSLYFAKYKTVSLQIYGNNVTGAKGCHFESKKAHFTVALMASDVKANYTPTRQDRNQSQRGTLSWRHTHRSLESQHSFHTMLINDRLKQRMLGPPSPIKEWKGQDGHRSEHLVPATRKAEARGLLESRSSRPAQVTERDTFLIKEGRGGRERNSE